MFHGTYTAIITPFRAGKVDEKKLEELVSLQVDAGVQGIVPCGTTGESLFLCPLEQKRIIEICVTGCQGKALVLPGTGALSTEETLALTQTAQKAGADGALVITPWYIRPSQESLFQHYKKISDTLDFPFIVYNNPTRTGCEIAIETVRRLTSLKNFRGFKEASPCLQRVPLFKQITGEDVSLLAGNDDVLHAYLAMGGEGGILVASNVAPTHFVALMKAWDQGNIPSFKAIWKDLFPLISALGLESNPIPIKYAMHLAHGVSLEYRLPYVSLNPSTKEAIEKALQGLGLWQPLSSVRER